MRGTSMSLNNIANPKSILAKLLAQENLTVEHRKVYTASFDPVNRILCLPIWKNMSSDLYDLLVGHEVGHAWETPATGWHYAIEEKGKGFKSFLNVVEDARIEKCIKTRYPGLRAPFYRAYKDLFESDFFGIKKFNKEIDELSLIDRLNLHFKVGPFLNVPFLENEKKYVNRMENLQSWDDVYQVASELYTYHKEENPFIDVDDIEDYEMSYCDDDGDDYEEYDDDAEINPIKKAGKRGQSNPESITDNHFREKEKELLADDIKPYVYCNIPLQKQEKYIVGHKDLYRLLDFSKVDNFKSFFNESYVNNTDLDIIENAFNPNRLAKEYRERNLKYIMYLVKEFELKRNAAQYARASVSKSGELDLNKVWAFKLKEDLFKRVTKIPKGKNHGMVMFIDWSGSMAENLSNTIEQVLILADFCKKVSIPFDVYAFSDSRSSFRTFFSAMDESPRYLFKEKDLHLDLTSFCLLNFLSSSMTSNEYRQAQYRLLQISDAYKKDKLQYGTIEGSVQRSKVHALPNQIGLGGTPLDEAIVLANTIVAEFKLKYKLDITNTIFLTDGDGAEHNCFIENNKITSFQYKSSSKFYNVVLKDVRTGIQTVAKPHEPVTVALLKMLKETTGTNLVGYFVYNGSSKNTLVNMANRYGQFINLDQASNFIKKFKYFGMQNTGYDDYFLVKNKDMEISDQGLDIGTDNSKRSLVKAFVQNQKSKILNRVLLSKFIERIA